MHSLECSAYLLLIISILYALALVAFVVIPAAFNISLDFRQPYINFLLKVFEYGRKVEQRKAEEAKKKQEEDEEKPLRSPLKSVCSFEDFEKTFHVSDACEFFSCGMQEIIEDNVTKRFDAEELDSWNLLTRTTTHYHFISWKLTIIWAVGFFFRYFIFLPVRFSLMAMALGFISFCMTILPFLPEGRFRRTICNQGTMISFRIMARALSAVIRFHDKQNKAKGGGICVANHTSPIDAIFLACDNSYALIGQMQGGIMGYVQKILLKAQDHIFFERSQMKDRQLVVQRMMEHVEDPDKSPILIFPEGTCINNTSVMMFKKGSFEVGGTIYPVAIKYDPTFGNAFWNSSKEPMLQYIISIMTSWAIVCDVWYLPPMEIKEGESSIQFANRVKKSIARRGGLVDLVWDGQLKRMRVPQSLRAKEQANYAKKLKVN